eukprot:7555068-Pyramimonas_sp.AAC.1
MGQRGCEHEKLHPTPSQLSHPRSSSLPKLSRDRIIEGSAAEGADLPRPHAHALRPCTEACAGQPGLS